MDVIGYRCMRCGKTVTDADLKARRGGTIAGKVYCLEHFQQLMAMSSMKTKILDKDGEEVDPDKV